MAPFYGWGSTTSRLEPLRGGSLLFTTKFLSHSLLFTTNFLPLTGSLLVAKHSFGESRILSWNQPFLFGFEEFY